MSQPQLLKASTLLSHLPLFRNVDIESIDDCLSRCEFRELLAEGILLSPDKCVGEMSVIEGKNPYEQKNLLALINAADEGLYRAKNSG